MSFVVIKNSKNNLIKVSVMAAAILGSGVAFADNDKDHDSKMTQYMDNCENMDTVLNVLDPTFVNDKVCIDMPVNLNRTKAVFNLDAPITDSKGATGLRHMFMLGAALKAKIQSGEIDAEHVSVVGIMHGAALGWALKSNDETTKGWIEKIFMLKKAGVDINLEVCGVTMLSKGLSNAALYESPNGMIHINQGAVARILDLERHGFAYYQEGQAN